MFTKYMLTDCFGEAMGSCLINSESLTLYGTC